MKLYLKPEGLLNYYVLSSLQGRLYWLTYRGWGGALICLNIHCISIYICIYQYFWLINRTNQDPMKRALMVIGQLLKNYSEKKKEKAAVARGRAAL